MSKNLPSVFKNTIDKKICNNKTTFYSHYENVGNIDVVKEEKKDNNTNEKGSFNDNLDTFFRNNQFVFNVPVVITTKDTTVNTKILSKVGDHLLTSTGEIIQLKDIISIKVKE